MPRLLLAVLAAVLAAALLANPRPRNPAPAQSATASHQKSRKVAFLVGVSTFKHALAELGGVPEKDVAELEKVLARNGFKVVTLTGEKATKKEIEERFKRL